MNKSRCKIGTLVKFSPLVSSRFKQIGMIVGVPDPVHLFDYTGCVKVLFENKKVLCLYEYLTEVEVND